MDKDTGIIVIDSTKEKNEKLKNKWSKINKKANELTSLASSGFIISMLSPFDFDGPIIEVVTAAVAAVGFVMKKVSENQLDKLANNSSKLIDDNDKENLLNIFGNLGNAYKSKKNR